MPNDRCKSLFDRLDTTEPPVTLPPPTCRSPGDARRSRSAIPADPHRPKGPLEVILCLLTTCLTEERQEGYAHSSVKLVALWRDGYCCFNSTGRTSDE